MVHGSREFRRETNTQAKLPVGSAALVKHPCTVFFLFFFLDTTRGIVGTQRNHSTSTLGDQIHSAQSDVYIGLLQSD